MTEVAPTLVVEVMNRAVAAYQRGQLREADVLAHAALSAKSDHFDALYLIAVISTLERRFAEALAGFDRVLALQPDHAAAFNNRGVALQELRRLDEALASYDRALALRPDYAEALYNRGVTLQELKRFGDALADYDRAAALRPNYAEALNNRGNMMHQVKRFDEALASYDLALAVRANYAEAFYNRGVTLQELKRLDEAIASYDRALAVRPDYADALYNRGKALQGLKRFAEALANNDRALALRPDHADAHWNDALLRLLIGDYEGGWRKYEWRFISDPEIPRRTFGRPLWLGEQGIEGKTILLHAEQGFGDTIQFCRYIPLVAARGAKVLFAVQDVLRDLMRSFDGVAQVISINKELSHFDMDLQCPLLSLPLAFATTLETIPLDTPYLTVAQQSVRNWRIRLGSKRRPRVGIAWSGSQKPDPARSISFAVFSRLLDVDASFVSLQKEVLPADAAALADRNDLVQFGDELRTFADTAAVIANLDLVISIDTSVAHLAGALAKPAWILLPFMSDWRWLIERPDSPWYPTARLFRQHVSGDWPAVIDRVCGELEKLVRLGATDTP